MFGFVLVLLLLVGIFMSIVVLLQSGKGGGLASMGGSSAGTDSLIGGRQAATLLTKATWVSGGLFLFLALVLSIMSSRQTSSGPILRDLQQQAPAPPPRQLDLPGATIEQPGTPPAGAQPGAPAGAQPATPPTTTTGE